MSLAQFQLALCSVILFNLGTLVRLYIIESRLSRLEKKR